MPELKVVEIPTDELVEYENNAKLHPHEQVDQIANSIQEFGFNSPILAWHNDQGEPEIVAGHGRLMAARKLGLEKLPVVFLDHMSEEQRRAYILVDNKLTMNSDFDFEILADELGGIADIDMSQYDFTVNIENLGIDNLDADTDEEVRRLQDDFLIPPFDVFDAKQKSWLERKRIWRELIGDLGQARADAKAYEDKTFNNKESYTRNGKMPTGVSILDPVLSEIVLNWFTPHGRSNVFDCFAGDTVFGYVSGKLGHKFTGIELRQEQVDFNVERTKGLPVKYICDDGQNVAEHIQPDSQDLLFSCPPYYDLEVYSDDPNDASNQSNYEDFYKILDNAFSSACKCLRDNRFAVIVCGDIRDKKGAYRNFPNDIVETFKRNGLALYNNIKLLTPYGTAQIRARRYMRSRKTCHVYQDVLVFYKGDMKSIKNEFPEIEADYASYDMELQEVD